MRIADTKRWRAFVLRAFLIAIDRLLLLYIHTHADARARARGNKLKGRVEGTPLMAREENRQRLNARRARNMHAWKKKEEQNCAGRSFIATAAAAAAGTQRCCRYIV